MLTATKLQVKQRRMTYHEAKELRGAVRRALRELYGLTLATVARELGLTIPRLSQIERGANVKLDHALKIAKFWEKSVEEIWQSR